MAETYELSFPGSRLAAETFTVDPTRLRSEAIHVSQIGFRPDDPAKIAFLSCWMGNGGGVKYEAGLPFSVIEEATGTALFRGRTVLSKPASEKNEDAYGKNYNGTDVHAMEFSALTKPGRYRICVETIGCSYPFEIGEEVWRKAFTVSARGFYHQRSGIALGEPFSSFKRPRPFHPDDGIIVHASKTPLIDTGNGLNEKDTNFGNLVKGKTDEIVPQAWGGYMDAGDWDRRIQHLKSSRLLLELAELFPDYFAGLSLNIPESGNGLPDIVNEALFNLDFYRRLQTPGGGVRGGIESSEHPRRGEASFQESLAVMAYAPDAFSSYVYAGVAARAAGWLASRDARRAEVYRETALRAMNWAEADREREEHSFLMGKHPGRSRCPELRGSRAVPPHGRAEVEHTVRGDHGVHEPTGSCPLPLGCPGPGRCRVGLCPDRSEWDERDDQAELPDGADPGSRGPGGLRRSDRIPLGEASLRPGRHGRARAAPRLAST